MASSLLFTSKRKERCKPWGSLCDQARRVGFSTRRGAIVPDCS